MTDDARLGKLLSEHRRGDYRRRGLFGCAMLLALPFLCVVSGISVSLSDTGYEGVYEIRKRDGSKILVSRQYSEIARIDDELKRFCDEARRG